MANFRTHLGIGTVASGLLVTLAFGASIISENDVLAVAMAGVLGSILPDVDLQKSRPSRIIFFFLGLFFSFCVLFTQSDKLSVVELWILWLAVFLGVRYCLQMLFHHFAVHRGIFHSILAGLFFFVLTTLVFYYILERSALVSWVAGEFVFFGYLVHLTLDEIYSVDFDDKRVKRSFGTAMKLFDYGNIRTSATMLVATIALFFATPSMTDLIQVVKERPVSALLQDRFLPEGTIFNLDKHVSNFVKSAKSLSPSKTQEPPKEPETPPSPIGSTDSHSKSSQLQYPVNRTTY